MQREAEKKTELPSDWLEKYFLVNDPRDPVTGEFFPPGPIRLAEHQKRIINEMLSRKPDGTLKYSTVIYSAPKKSGKSAIAAAMVLYMACHNSNSYLACLANDGKQSTDRLYAPIYTCFRLHRQIGGLFKDVEPNKTEVILPNFTKIEAVPTDAAGQAGSQPLVSAFSELWGYTTDRKQMLWSEMTVPPTLYGRALRIVESYAGHTGESILLENLYRTGFEEGQPHPDFLDLQGKHGPVVRVNESARMFTYWDTEPRMLWQTPEYYQEEAAVLVPSEMRRIHGNEWVSALGSFVESTWWDACISETLPTLSEGSRVPVVVGIDMANTRDCAALVAVSRDPHFPETQVAVRAVKIFNPKYLGGIIDQEEVVRPVIEQWAKQWNVVCWVYDPKEMAKLAQDLVREGVGWFKVFGQQNPRAVSDKELHDMIVTKQVVWNPNTTEGDIGYKGDQRERDTLYRHITRAGADTSGGAYRIEKLSNSVKIDGAVALSMAAHICLKLSIHNNELDPKHLLKQLQEGSITVDKFSELMRQAHPRLVEHGR